MAEQTPPGPKTSGRIAGIVAVVVLVVGGYYGFVAKSATEPTAVVAEASKATTAPSGDAASTDAPQVDAAAPATAPADGTAAEASKAGAEARADAAAATDGSASPTTDAVAEAGPAAQSGDQSAKAAEMTAPDGSADQSSMTEKSAPAFDVVRVEPSGETVVAGLAPPKAKVEVLDGASPIGSTTANERGEWAMAIDKPLPPGTHDLSIRTTSPDGKTESLSEQRVAIEVPKKAEDEPLVVLNQPDAPSRVLQKPQAEPKIAESAPDAAGAPGEPAPADATKMADGAAGAEKPGEPPAPNMTAEGATPAPAAGGDTSTPEAMADASTPPDAAKATEQQEKAGTEVAAAGAPQPSAEAGQPEAGPKPQVTVDAVEFENGKLYVAGSAATGQTVRIYVDGTLLGQAKPGAGGRWLLEASRSVEPGRHSVRVDQVEDGTGDVIVRAEVPFDRTEDVAALAPVATEGSGSGGASASGDVPPPQTVIIRRGDNLWRISRRLYGRGIRFSTIYEANDDQIRNPHWIYPGQVFVLPAGDTGWTN